MLQAWGDEQTKFFFELTPDRVLAAVESAGFRCTGRCLALNSFENRVYDVELESERSNELESERSNEPPASPSANRRVVKFYRPGRWTREQILEEHEFIADLVEGEVPAIAPLPFPDGSTLRQTPDGGIFYALFPKVGGRAPDELSDEQLRQVGRLLARIHNIGALKNAFRRIQLNPETYGTSNLRFLLERAPEEGGIPLEFQARYRAAVEEIVRIATPWFQSAPILRLHGDCHLGNLLWSPQGAFFLDFDDMVRGPAVQDLWLLLPGRPSESAEARHQLETMLEGYEEMRVFDRSTLRLIEPLRALRYVHYSAWIARRWQDPAFPQAFPQFGSHRYWSDETGDLEKQLMIIREMDAIPR